MSGSSSLAVSPLTGTALAIACLAVGYYAGSQPQRKRRPQRKTLDAESSESSEDEDEAYAAANKEELSKLSAGAFEDSKLVLCVRTDLGMSKGKIAAQCSHATLACYKTILRTNPALLKTWERGGQAKIALKVDSEDEMLLLEAQATSLGLVARHIQDAGRTQIAAGSRTVLGIGPGPVKVINQVTSHLRLL